MGKPLGRRRAQIVIAAASATLFAASITEAADKYYVGPANGNVSGGAHWSLSPPPGGVGGAGVPSGTDSMRIQHNDATARNISLDTHVTITDPTNGFFWISN